MEAPQTDNLHDELLASLRASGATMAPDAYRIERVLKESDFEKTQLVYIRTLDGGELGPYVRKLISKEKGLGGTYRLLMDAQAKGKRLHHIPRIIRLDEGEETLEVVMEYVDGPSVREIAEVGVLGHGPDLAARLMPAVCDAVLDLHEQLGSPVIHRDLTPSNIICPEGDTQNPVLIDFAISRTWNAEAQSDTTHFGTRAYAPPEQFGFGQTDVRSDVYALGMLAFFCLTGRDPYPADRTVGFCDLAVPEAWRKVIEKACELDPSKRYENVRQLRLACEEAAKTTATPTSPSNEDGTQPARPQPIAESLHTGSGTPAPKAAAPEKPKASESHRSQKPAPRFFTVWNVIVLVAVAVCIAACLYDLAVPSMRLQASLATNLFSFLVWGPCAFLLAGFILMDKRWLRANVPWFKKRTRLRMWRDVILAYAAVTAIWLAIIAIWG